MKCIIENSFFDQLVKTTFLKMLILTSIIVSSCETFVDLDPPNTRIVKDVVFNSDATATAAVIGIYYNMEASGFASGSLGSVTSLAGVCADEFVDHSTAGNLKEFYLNSINPNSLINHSLWSSAYNAIYGANAVLEGLESSKNISSSVRNQLEGEAKFIRAFSHFYLLNLYGDIPLITTTDYRVNAIASRNSVSQVYQQIIRDLDDAREKLGETYVTAERIRPNKWAAVALLARVYLYLEDWGNAESLATLVINNSSTYDLVADLNNVFLKNSKEAIWQLMSAGQTRNTWDGSSFILVADPTLAVTNSITLSNDLLNAFEAGDARRGKWVGSFSNAGSTWYFPYKYKIKTGSIVTEYSMVLRLAEQFLIRAEARAQQNKLLGLNSAESDINIIRSRAGLPKTMSTSQFDLLDDVVQERRLELFSEWGHRWMDLKRLRRADSILGAVKSNWDTNDVLFALPQKEMDNDPNLRPQNLGY